MDVQRRLKTLNGVQTRSRLSKMGSKTFHAVQERSKDLKRMVFKNVQNI